MNFNQLRFTVAVAESGSFRKAAEACHATQPTLSNSIAQLEDELGGRLFARTTRQVTTTPFGDYMLPLINAVLRGRDDLLKEAAGYHDPERQLMRIGLSPLVDVERLHRVVAPYQQRYPGHAVVFKECLLDDLAERLRREQIDIALIPTGQPRGTFQVQRSHVEELLYIPKQSELSVSSVGNNSHSLRVSELPEAPIILTNGACGLDACVRDLFESQNVPLKRYPGHAVSYHVIEQWAQLGVGAGILPRPKLAGDAMRAVPLLLQDGRAATVEFEWRWRPGSSLDEKIDRFLGCL